MFNPKYTITARLLANVKRIALLTEELNNKKFTDVVLLEFERSARALSSFSSTSIEGNPLPLAEVKKILKTSPKFLRDTEKEVLNYNNALEFLSYFHKTNKPKLTKDLILTIQKMVVLGLLKNNHVGKLRNEPVFVNNPKIRKTVYLPPDSKDVATLIDELISFIDKHSDSVDPLILAGIFHKQFVIIHPFIDGNGRTTRLATKMLLAGLGINTFNLFSFENYYNKNVDQYFEKVGVLGNYYEIRDMVDFTVWLEYFTDGIIDELLRVGKEIEKIIISPNSELKPHHKSILDYIEKKGFITDMMYSKITKRAKATRAQDFNNLIKRGLLVRLGDGRGTYYKLNNDA